MHDNMIQNLKNEQNFPFAVIAGLIAAVVGAFIWAGVSVLTGYQIGWMVIGIGFIVGFAIRTAGKGFDLKFGIAGSVLSLTGCLLGNFIILLYYVSTENSIPFTMLFKVLDFSKIPSLMLETAGAMDVVFYGLAIYEGFRFSRNSVAVTA